MKRDKTRTSLSLPHSMLKALALIKKTQGVQKGSQIEIGMMLYFNRHKSFLLSKGIDLWKEN